MKPTSEELEARAVENTELAALSIMPYQKF